MLARETLRQAGFPIAQAHTVTHGGEPSWLGARVLRNTIHGNAFTGVQGSLSLLVDNAIWLGRTQGIGYLDLAGCMALGITGPILRSTGLPWDIRKADPYCGFENYEFDVPTATTCDDYGRFLIRLAEIEQSLNIVEQCLDKLEPGPVFIEDKKIAWPARLTPASGSPSSPSTSASELSTPTRTRSASPGRTSARSPRSSRRPHRRHCRPARRSSRQPWRRGVCR